MFLYTNQLSWAHLLPSRALSHRTLLSRSLMRSKSALLMSRAVGLFFTLLPPLGILKSTVTVSPCPDLQDEASETPADDCPSVLTSKTGNFSFKPV